MTIEAEVALLTSAVQLQTAAVATQQIAVTSAVSAIAATTSRVNALSAVQNTADTDKPVSTAQQTALDAKQITLVSGINISTVNGVSLLGGLPLVIARSATSLVALAYQDRATLRSVPQLPSVLDDSVIIEGLGLFMFVDTTQEPDDDETCFTAATGQWLLKTPAYDLLSAWALIEDSVRDELNEDESIRFAAYFAKL
jgi:hypothetical protein